MLHGLAADCHEAGNGGYIGSHCPKQLRASSLLGEEKGFPCLTGRQVMRTGLGGLSQRNRTFSCFPQGEKGLIHESRPVLMPPG